MLVLFQAGIKSQTKDEWSSTPELALLSHLLQSFQQDKKAAQFQAPKSGIKSKAYVTALL